MYWKIPERLRDTAAWRFSALTTVAFAVLTGAAFFLADVVVARAIRERGDAWLRGETELLAAVVENTQAGMLEDRLVEEVAELATHEVQLQSDTGSAVDESVFFLVTAPDGTPQAWVGSKDRERFLEALRRTRIAPGHPRSIGVEGFRHSFRVDANHLPDGSTVYLGLVDHAARTLGRRIAIAFGELWLAMVVIGFVVSWTGARRILRRVEGITETAAGIGAGDLNRRVPAGVGSDEITRLAGTFNGMLDRIQGSVEQIRALGDAVAHDLRSPVTAIRGNLEMALARGDPVELQEAVAKSLEGVDRMLAMLDTSLDVAEAEAGALRLNRTDADLREIASAMVEFYQPAAEERGITLDLSSAEPARGRFDAKLLRRAVANLLDNTLQHLPPGRHVRVRTGARDGRLVLEVQDDGPGFPADLRERAFERFAKGRDSDGSGIGLALVRAAAIAHGGEARILDVPGGGACVRVTLPIEARAARPA